MNSVSVLVSYAQTLNGVLGRSSKEATSPLAISCDATLFLTHVLRGLYDGVLVGIDTILSDDPQLSQRVGDYSATGRQWNGRPLGQPWRLVLDSRLRTPENARIFSELGDKDRVILFYYSRELGPELLSKKQVLEGKGATLVPLSASPLPWDEVLAWLADHGLQSLFIEGGGAVLSSALSEGIEDSLIITQAPTAEPRGTSVDPKLSRKWNLTALAQGGSDLVLEYSSTGQSTIPMPGLAEICENSSAPDLKLLFTRPSLGPTAELVKARQLVFTAPRKAAVRTIDLRPKAGEVLVRSRLQGISAGTEMAVYRGECQDFSGEAIASLQPQEYPLTYGYINVGEDPRGRRVFGFALHQDWFAYPEDGLIDLGDLSWEDGIFLASTETAVSIVHDTHARLGDVVAVAGQGVVGLLVTQILLSHGVKVLALDPDPYRRKVSHDLGAQEYNPLDPDLAERLTEVTDGRGWDKAIHCSGNFRGLQTLIDHAPFESTIVEASWYADKPVSLNLGQAFHRRRLSLVSSQVSNVGRPLGPRWTKARRMGQVVDLLGRLRPSRFITHRFGLDKAAEAYTLLDNPTEPVLQVVIDPGQ